MRYIANHMVGYLGAIALTVGISFLLLNARQMGKKYLQLKDLIMENTVAYVEEETQGIKDVTKGELIYILNTESEYDIELDGTLLTTKTYNPQFFDYSSLASFYSKQYIFDKNGRIQRIVYKRK